ncbi:MAG: TetR/AcrR family transcriptional regulator [Leptotrichiaceae bacterium]|nr:TetR/AcrR family transcriptional regulator [Leptotrichiaceae bacterium]MBP6281189.1 TetR/AcrR family transcriptional regulator [Leptotrichiaceae bacterium]MBP7100253.1 TetR/AcrR family transcriptional regulator [Leptotrichiaceae bacterium]MBP7739260.1 TetR/AcrR family transcriptional regulator [Leptotrichiaceae bacterium]MBP9629012.1 TetR/AcrR family transcriptional regulator [Leptotrichiaceae bacterium]
MNKVIIKKNNVIKKSAKLFYYNGYKNTSLSDILTSCNIPKGSFYYYFKGGKEELLLEVIKYHTENLINFFNYTVDDLSIFKLKTFFFQYFNNIENNKFNGGSPLGNIAIELSDINDTVRLELSKSYRKIELRFSFFLTTLKNNYKEKYQHVEPEMYARILVSLLEGTMLKLKIEKSEDSITDFLSFYDKIFKSSTKYLG